MKTVLVTGTFDFLHRGHLRLFEEARRYGDRLAVIVARDNNVKKIKGKAPLHTQRERLALVSSVRLVDRAYLGDSKDPYKIIRALKPDVICLGYDQTHTIARGLKQALKTAGLLRTRVVTLKPYQARRLKSSNRRAAGTRAL